MMYRIEIVLCANAETALSSWGEDPTGNGWHDECRAAVSAEREAINGTEPPTCLFVSVTEDSNFQNWNGGRYSHQAAKYEWDTSTGLGAVRVSRLEPITDDDGDEIDEEEIILPASEYPAEIRAWIDLAESAASQAGAEIEANARAAIKDAAVEHLCECADRAVDDPEPRTIQLLAKAVAHCRRAIVDAK